MSEIIDPVDRRAFAGSVREFSKRRDVLFHGTRHGTQILAENRLRYSIIGYQAVSFTRSVEVGTYWALLPRDIEEKVGAVLIFDRQKLRTRHRLELFHDPIWDSSTHINDEAEERVMLRDITDLSSLLLGVVWQDGTINEIDRRPTSSLQFWSKQDIAQLEHLADTIFLDGPRLWREHVG